MRVVGRKNREVQSDSVRERKSGCSRKRVKERERGGTERVLL